MGEAREYGGHVDLARRQQRSDRDPTADEPAQLVDLALDAVDLGQDAPGSGGDRLAGLGRHDAATRALEELGSQLLLEPLDLVREGRLGDVKLLGGAGEVAMAGDRLGVDQLAKLDRSIVNHD
jgi:hypothetical protein